MTCHLDWRVRRGEIVDLRGLWREGHGLSVASEALELSSRGRRAAPSLRTQSEKPLVARYGLAETVTLSMLRHGSSHRLAATTPSTSPRRNWAISASVRTASIPATSEPPAWSGAARMATLADSGGLWRKGHGLSVRSEVMGRFCRVRRAASSLQLPFDEPVVASCGLAKTADRATLTMLCRPRYPR